MKVLHLTKELHDGAGKAANRLVAALRKYTDIQADIADKTMIPGISDLAKFPLKYRALCRLETFALKHSCNSNPISRSTGLVGNGIVGAINKSDADIIHLHWINGAFLSIADIAKIRKPLVWTLHDSWAFCGTEHHPDVLQNDLRWKTGYRNSSRLTDSTGIDLDKWIWRWKKYCWQNKNITFAAPSNWESNMLSQSALFRNRQCFVIPNGVDTEVFTQGSQAEAREKLHIPLNKKVILFGAVSVNNPIKGYHFLQKTFAKLSEMIPDAILVCFGKANDETILQNTKLPVMDLGVLTSEEQLADTYRAADVFVCPSIIDNLPSTCIEAQACGLPVAAFDVGGISDIVKHKQTGYLALPYDTDDLFNGIYYCLENKNMLAETAVVNSSEKFNYKNFAVNYEKLYQQIMKKF